MSKFYFDPGGACAGWALFSGPQLIACGLSRTKLKSVQERANAHHAELKRLGAYTLHSGGVKSEMMWHRPRKGKKGDYIPPQDLIHTNLIAGRVGTEWIYPQDWKGMVPKETHQPKILACLTKEELDLVEKVMPKSLRHNVIDAIGIGLHDVGRLAKEVETQACQQVKQLIELTKSLSARRSGRGTTSTKSKGTRGKRRPTRQSFITLPKGGIKMPAPTAPATFHYPDPSTFSEP